MRNQSKNEQGMLGVTYIPLYPAGSILVQIIKNSARIKSRTAANKAFSFVKPLITERNAERLFFMILKKTTKRSLKIHIAQLFLSHLDSESIFYNDRLTLHFRKMKSLFRASTGPKTRSIIGKRLGTVRFSMNLVSSVYGSAGKLGNSISNLPRS